MTMELNVESQIIEKDKFLNCQHKELVLVKCPNCEKIALKPKSKIHQSHRRKRFVFCNSTCFSKFCLKFPSYSPRPVGRKHSEETKLKLSELKKKFLRENPDKHNWKRHDKFISVPCEKVKTFLREEEISFSWELEPSTERFFSIDIAFPDRMIGLEINGNQHYSRDGKLKPYYQERQEFLESLGWKIHQIHYSLCFKKETIIPIIRDILRSEIKKEFDYLNYKPRIAEPKIVKEKPFNVTKEEFEKVNHLPSKKL